MLFSSISFLFFFLPLLFIIYFTVPKKYRNIVLLIFSILFYTIGEKHYVLLLLFTCLINYIFGRLIEDKNNKKIYLTIGLIINIGLLFYFKYTNFFLETFTNLLNLNEISLKIILPLGISFFTFQNISYLVDVYRKDVKCEKNILNYCTYITFFPQLIAGPIVRYKDIKEELQNREESIKLFSEGITRFIIGLGKKVLIADNLFNLYTTLYNSNLTTLSYWIIALCFTFQIYYDFSGYSDMAIGLGKMFGFNLKENFNYPLVSKSITEFWRRWHMSLSSFFKDYIYIPLGGNRCSKIKNFRNILIVWLLTGLWHGADWNFIIWGLYFFIFLIIEKYILKNRIKDNILSYFYTFIIVLISFIIFNISDLKELLIFFKSLIGINIDLTNFESLYYLKNNLIILLIATIGISPFLKNKINTLKKGKLNKVIECLSVVYIFIIFLISIAHILSSTFNPFIYFRF